MDVAVVAASSTDSLGGSSLGKPNADNARSVGGFKLIIATKDATVATELAFGNG